MRIVQGIIAAALLGFVLSVAGAVDIWLSGGPRLPELPAIAWFLYIPAGSYVLASVGPRREVGPLRWGGHKARRLVRALPGWARRALAGVIVVVAVQTYFALTHPVTEATQTSPLVAGLGVLASALAAAGAYALWLEPRRDTAIGATG